MTFDTRCWPVSVCSARWWRAAVSCGPARRLGLTPSGVSRAVARLEARVGVRLFDRTPRAVSLTDEGRRFYAQVMPLLAGLEEAASDAAGAAASVRGRLRVNVDPWFARLVLAPRFAGFLAAHPALSLELVVRDRLGELIAEGFDAAVRFGEPEPSGLIARKLLETRILACAAPAYLARHGAPEHPRDLERHECLMFRDPVTGRPFPWEFRRGDEVLCVGAWAVGAQRSGDQACCCAAGFGIAQTIELGVVRCWRVATGAGSAQLGGGAVSALRILSLAAFAAGEGARVSGFRCRECKVVTVLRRLAMAECASCTGIPLSLRIFVNASAAIAVWSFLAADDPRGLSSQNHWNQTDRFGQ